jgi:cytidine deaminase
MSLLELKDQQLLENARSIIAKRFKANYHHAGAALRTKSGKVFSAVHLEAYVGRVAVGAEAIAQTTPEVLLDKGKFKRWNIHARDLIN